MVSGVYKAVEALLRGQECGNLLKMQLENHETYPVQTEALVSTLLDSFSTGLSYFMSITSSDTSLRHESSSQNKAPKFLKKKSSRVEGLEHYRDDSPTPLHNDHFLWRKYGQKTIKASPYQRCYYRCTYAKSRNCNATKRVQKIQDNPSVYRTTYVGQHICEVSASPQPNDDDTYGSKMTLFEEFDQAMANSFLTKLVPFVDQETIKTDIDDQKGDENNKLVVGDDQFWGWGNELFPMSPGQMMFFDNIAPFDYSPFKV